MMTAGTFEDLHHPIAVRLNDEVSGGVLLGKCQRNSMTGLTTLSKATIMTDFCIIDLWERSALYGAPCDLVEDPYVFKIVPLSVRTWIYHNYFSSSEHAASAEGENGVIEAVLKLQVIDTQLPHGAWSPALCGVPVAGIAVLTADVTTVMVSLLMALFNIIASFECNSVAWYYRHRPITFVPRLVFWGFLWVRMFARMDSEYGGPVATISFIAMICTLVFDFVWGDFRALMAIGWRCSYRVMRSLPNRIFVCKKEGASFLPDPEHGREIDQTVSGFGFFDDMAIIVETRGLVLQLKPMDKADWQQAWQQRSDTGRPVSFVGLDVFNKDHRTVDDIERHYANKKPDGAREALIAMVAGGGHKKDADLLE